MSNNQEEEFDETIRKRLFSQVCDGESKPPCKVTVVGVGSVGMACSISILLKHLATDLILVDVIEDKLKGEVLDLNHGNLFLSNVHIDGGKDYALSAGSKIVVVTAGARQQVGESRLSLVQRNVNIFKHIIPKIAEHSPDAIIIVVSNPVDLMTFVAWKLSGFPRHRVLGTGTNLDSARFRHIISTRLKVSPSSVHACIVGEHGDSSVPLWSCVSVSGRSLTSIEPNIGKPDGPKGWDKVHKEVVDGAYDVIRLKGYTNWAIGLSCAEMVESILKNKHRIMPVSCFVKGVVGIKEDVCLSLPCVLNASGVSSVVEVSLNKDEKSALDKSASLISEVQAGLKW
uniref:L-lactate dehydrogenase n=1 Tax=Ciona intestinalis TaxID=7719 RepID=F6XLK3_CIOIN|nr:L-lactate dehydrogenase B-B chain-like [Ciona intestinalis]|eukprot:XP_002126740.1 L-lactate dehydrogenase B-B chain-like [Ciona intestinalis]